MYLYVDGIFVCMLVALEKRMRRAEHRAWRFGRNLIYACGVACWHVQ